MLAPIALVTALALADPSATQPGQTSDPAAPAVKPRAERTKLLVLDLDAVGVEQKDAHFVTAEVARTIGEPGTLEVLTAEDLRRLAALEGDRQAAGCLEQSCLAELANAMGAEYVVFGSIGRVDTSFVVELSLFHASEARAVNRRVMKGAQLSDVIAKVRPTVHDLAGPLLPALDAPPPLSLIAGGIVAGCGAVVALISGGVAGYASAVVLNDKSAAYDRNTMKGIGALTTVVSALAGVTALGGAAVVGYSVVSE